MKPRRPLRSLATRASLQVFILSLFCVIFVTTWQLIVEYRDEKDRVTDQMNGLKDSLTDVVARSLWIYDEDQLRTILHGLKSLDYVSHAQIEDNDLMRIRIGREVPDAIKISVPIYAPNKSQNKDLIGRLHIESNLSSLREKVLTRILSTFASNFVLIMLISAITIFIFQLQVTRPLNHLSQFAKKIQLSNSSLPPIHASASKGDEIAQVYHALAVMHGNIQADYQTILKAEEELKLYKNDLETLVEERTEKLNQTTKNLIDSSRKAGMAEVAIGVLHNIGNVLTGANVRVEKLKDRIDEDEVLINLRSGLNLLEEKRGNLDHYLKHDRRGEKLLDFLEASVEKLLNDHEELKETIRLQRLDLGTISSIINKQQEQAKFTGLVENIDFAACIDDVLSLYAHEINRQQILIEKDFEAEIIVTSDRHKILQIVGNLLSNAIQASSSAGCEQTREKRNARVISLSLKEELGTIIFAVRDTGIGISEEQKPYIFRYGYTTKKDGHGFGLHSSALDARLLGGSLQYASEGFETGSIFYLTLPLFKAPITKGFKSTPNAGIELS